MGNHVIDLRLGDLGMRKKYVPPSITETAFNCPHCGALTSQYWFEVYAVKLEDRNTPFIPDANILKEIHKGLLMMSIIEIVALCSLRNIKMLVIAIQKQPISHLVYALIV
jgi:hypothetical protein